MEDVEGDNGWLSIKQGDNMHITKFAWVVIVLAINSVGLAQESSVILKQNDTPLEITLYQASFEAETRATAYSRGNSDQIVHSVTYKNVSGKDIVALQIGLNAFDAFNGFMGRSSGWSTELVPAGASKKASWAQKPYSAFTFKNYGTGVVYINAVRFSDGTIWRANLAEILTELQKFEKELKREDLVEPKQRQP
jgi:hypothetical protein